MKSEQKSPEHKYDANRVNQTQLKQLNQPEIYFQKQSSNLLCGMHAVNNFLGIKKYTVDDMNEICYTLAEGKKVMNPHKHWIMQGDFDINVLMVALGKQGFETNWHDQRKDFSTQTMKFTDGFLINIESRRGFMSRLRFDCCHSGRHWLTIKKMEMKIQDHLKEVYLILDSLQNGYRMVEEKQAIEYLRTVEKENGQVLLIEKRNGKDIKMKSD